MKIVFSSNISWSIYNFRRGLLNELKKDGNIIFTVALKDEFSEKLENLGFTHTNVFINNNSKNPIKDLYLIYQYYKIYKKIAPDIICHNAIKPNIYGTIAAGIIGIPTINNISGLGTLFIKKSLSTRIAKLLYRISQRKASKIFFQNNDDLNLFLKNKLISKDKCLLIPGSGVDTSKFFPVKKTNYQDDFKFLFVGRLLYDKGIREYIDAIKIIKSKNKNIEFQILGPIYSNNTTSISQENLNDWLGAGLINYLGETDDVLKYMVEADCLVLPSYREGLSKVLIEGSSVALPIITTNVPGCKDVVIDNVTGFLCEVKNSKDLADKMVKMINLPIEERLLMGDNGRNRAINVFDEQIIIKHYKDAIYSTFEKK
tara:strand:+ start:253 stop:1368 length:1116 start_codon:yes stop_codon:yes gene_type:complete